MAFDFDKKLKEFERLKVTLPKVISNDGQRYFLKNFDKEQWEGQRWARRRDHTNRRKLLVKSGALRRAVSNARREALLIGSDLKYLCRVRKVSTTLRYIMRVVLPGDQEGLAQLVSVLNAAT
jgi:hypothetical protein